VGGRSDARDRLAVALDVPDLASARDLVTRLEGRAGWIKVGSELFTAAGPAALEVAAPARLFLDTKLHDIPTTVARAVGAAARHGVEILTLHAAGGAAMLRAAREAADETAAALGTPPPRLVAVTVLTSLSLPDLEEQGIRADSLEDHVARLVDLALGAGLDGVVASARELPRVRARAGRQLFVVTPGIRPAQASHDDQVRTATPAEAVRAGADLLVIGRPIARAPDPAAAAAEVEREIEAALGAG